jgi:hypothetical protein
MSDNLTKLNVIYKILDMYPYLETDKYKIISSILGITEKKQNGVVILDKEVIDGQSYYFNNEGIIFDSNSKIVGFYVVINKKKIYLL